MFRSFRHYNFRLWFAGLVISNLGVWMQRTAQDWIVLTELTDQNATAVGMATALQFAPQLVLATVTGTVADRMDRRVLLAITQSVMAVLAAALAVIALLGVLDIWMLFGFSLALGVANAFDIPARQAFVGQIVSKENLGNAVALNSAGFNLARLGGPALAGLSVAAIGAGWVFALNAASFVAVLISLVVLRTGEINFVEREKGGRGHFRAGLRYLRTRPDAVMVMVVMFIFGTLGLNMPVITTTMTSIEFGEGAEVFGILTSAIAIGSLAGSLVAARLETIRLRHLAIAAAAYAVASFVAALMPTVWTFALMLIPIGLCTMTMISSANAYMQITTPAAFRGRVLAIYLALFIGATPAGAPLAGGIADAFGPRWTLTLSVTAGLVASVIIVVWVLVHHRARLGWDPDRRWRLRLRYGRALDTPEEAEEELAIAEARIQRS